MENTNQQKIKNENKNGNKKGMAGSVIMMAGMMLVGAACGVYMAGFLEEAAADGGIGRLLLCGAICLLELYLAMFLQIIIHEGGHLVFGLCSGYRFSSFRIGSFMWIKEDGKLRLRRLSLAGTGGQCLMCPPDLVNGRIPYVLYNLGGSLMNLAAAAVCFGIAQLVQKEMFVFLFFIMMALIGVAFALFNGIPMHVGQVDNDGYNAWSLGKSPQALRAFWLQMKINERIAEGERLKDMPEEWFVIPSDEEMKNSMIAAIGVMACNRLIDAMRFAKADQEMERQLMLDSGIVELHRRMMIEDQIYCELTGECREERLTRLYDKTQKKFEKTMKSYPSILRTQYVYALLSERDEEKAAQLLEKFERMAKKYPHPAEIESEQKMMEYAREIYRKRHKIPDEG